MTSNDGTGASEKRAFWRRRDTYSRPSTVAENPIKLGQAALWISEEHQPELTDHGIKAIVRIAQCLAVEDFKGDWQSLKVTRATSSMVGEMSPAITEPVGPTTSATARAAAPVPVATSSIRLISGRQPGSDY